MQTPSLLAVSLLAASFAVPFAVLGCHAQPPATGPVTIGQPLPVATARRVEVLLRQKAQLPPGSTIAIATPAPSELAGYATIAVTFTNEGKSSKPVNFLLSSDGKQVAQFTKYDISADPKALISAAGRPSRGGPEAAPVVIVGFDDLECPFCARLHSTIFPAIQQRYGDKVRVVYKDFPLPSDMHPWAMRASVDVNCMAEQSPAGYWNLVDYIHGHYGEIGVPAPGKEKTLTTANEQLDKLTHDQAAFQKVDVARLDACVSKQDTTAILASQKTGTALGVDSTPSLFINGDKVDGAVPIEFIFNIIDNALRAENIPPPPPYVVPAPPAPKATTPPAGQ